MVVELDMFSGRQNPCWRLPKPEALEVARLIAGLEPVAGRPLASPPGLGYRGFRLSGSAGASYVAYGGVVRSPDTVLGDPDRRVERFLLEHLPAEFSELRGLVEAELGAV